MRPRILRIRFNIDDLFGVFIAGFMVGFLFSFLLKGCIGQGGASGHGCPSLKPSTVDKLVEKVSKVKAFKPTILKVTAYCPGPCCCGKWADGHTASGHKIQLDVFFPTHQQALQWGVREVKK